MWRGAQVVGTIVALAGAALAFAAMTFGLSNLGGSSVLGPMGGVLALVGVLLIVIGRRQGQR